MIAITSEGTCRHGFPRQSQKSAVPTRQAIDAVERGGTLVLKSRPPHAIPIAIERVVSRSLRLQGAPYGSFTRAASLMANPDIDFESLFGETFPLAAYAEAFSGASSAERHKFFLRIGAE